MKSKKLTELTLEELNKQKRSLNGVIVGIGIVMLIASGTLLYLIAKSKNFALIGVVPACFISVLPATIRLSQINAELKSRASA